MGVLVALRKACLNLWFDVVVEMCTFSPIVHSEVWICEECTSKETSYAAYDDEMPCFVETKKPRKNPFTWVFFRIPVPSEKVSIAQSFLDEIKNSNLTYRFPWKCECPQCLLRVLENDLDCNHPETWGSVFCSQATLLFLRRCACAGILQSDKSNLLFDFDSNGVSPAQLYKILTQMGCDMITPQ